MDFHHLFSDRVGRAFMPAACFSGLVGDHKSLLVRNNTNQNSARRAAWKGGCRLDSPPHKTRGFWCFPGWVRH
jgi:hypothetical protein